MFTTIMQVSFYVAVVGIATWMAKDVLVIGGLKLVNAITEEVEA